jgi:hypothetical protein
MALRDEDIQLLKRVIESDKTRDIDRDSFTQMLIGLETKRWNNLTTKQRQWAKGCLDEPTYTNDWSAGKVPPGRPVPTPAVLQIRPLKPPGRK